VTSMLREASSARFRLIVSGRTARLSEMSPCRVIELPASVNAPAVALNERALICVAAGRLLFDAVRITPSKLSESFATGTPSGFQLAAVFQLLFAPPPSQVKLAARAASGWLRAISDIIHSETGCLSCIQRLPFQK